MYSLIITITVYSGEKWSTLQVDYKRQFKNQKCQTRLVQYVEKNYSRIKN